MRWFFILLILAMAAWFWSRRPISHSDGVMISSAPIQTTFLGSQEGTQREGFHLRPLAGTILEGRVLRTKKYHSGPTARLAPYDVGLGWKKMSDSAVLRQLKFSQSNRFLFWKYQNPPPLPPEQIVREATNCHLIAATPEIAREIASLRVGELIRIEGCLVEAIGPGGYRWTSSTRRDDTGNGACEIIWVSRLTKI